MKVFELRNLIHEILVDFIQEGRPLGSKNKPKTTTSDAQAASSRNNILVSAVGKWVAKTQKQGISQLLQETLQEIVPRINNPTVESVEKRLSEFIKRGFLDLSVFLGDSAFKDWFGNYLERNFDLSFLDVSYDSSRPMELEVGEGSLIVDCHFIGNQVDPEVEAPDPDEIKNYTMDRILSARGAQDVRVEWELRKYHHNDYYFYIDYSIRFHLTWDPGQEFSKLLSPEFIQDEIEKAIGSNR